MNKYAILEEFIVVEIIESDNEDPFLMNKLVVDITDLLIQPQKGWILSGNKLIPPASVNITEIVRCKIKKFQELAPELIIQIYITNTLLGITTQQSDQMFEDFSDVLSRLREGAWPTALYRLSLKQPSGFVTQQMLDSWRSVIITYLQIYG